MRIDEFEFRNEKGQEIEPTKVQLVVYIKSLHKDIKDLEAKLAKSEEKCKKAYQEGLLQKQFDKDMGIDQLKQQLAEKEKEIREIHKQLFYCESLLVRECKECDNKFKTDFAVEQLKKVKELLLENLYDLYSKPSEIWDKYGDLYDVVVEGAVNGTIDNQIKELKEKK